MLHFIFILLVVPFFNFSDGIQHETVDLDEKINDGIDGLVEVRFHFISIHS